jgi:hypothetical protein
MVVQPTEIVKNGTFTIKNGDVILQTTGCESPKTGDAPFGNLTWEWKITFFNMQQTCGHGHETHRLSLPLDFMKIRKSMP